MIVRSVGAALIAALVTMTVAGTVAGCSSPALVYGERNSLHIASLQVNDNTAEPLRLNIGFRRTIATKAPSLASSSAEGGGGEAVSAFSSFDLGGGGEAATTLVEPIVINTKFASGWAARALAANPAAVAQILNIGVGPDSQALLKEKLAAVQCLEQSTDTAVAYAAGYLRLPREWSSREGIKAKIDRMTPEQMHAWAAQTLNQDCGDQ